MRPRADGAPDGTPPHDQARGNGRSSGPNTNYPQVTEEVEQQPTSTIPIDSQSLQDAQDPVAGPLAVIVVAVLDFFRPTIFGNSWTPWLRAAFAVVVLTGAFVAVAWAVQQA
ncbi:hypothetical protein SAMN04488564_103289 [Lentzea waywayandensis]|uniref:Uncharacterized protein n=1 Tax=Lentzea waywayandensis TaxID=84724 RepID=A0A1I6DXI8_9PSEU|nr:hypothetical protein [Lentzea waywayandensis]SFR09998.1 hypothetical protein SAMN04488564_103289 [Lentzea waywayandensis]